MESEQVLQVDEHNTPIGPCSRSLMRARNLFHRASYILVHSLPEYILVQKRTLTKDYCPGYYDLATGGVVSYGESDEENGRRELFEELGLEEKMSVLGRFKYEDDNTRVWGNLFEARIDGHREIKLQAEEVDSVEKWSVEEVR